MNAHAKQFAREAVSYKKVKKNDLILFYIKSIKNGEVIDRYMRLKVHHVANGRIYYVDEQSEDRKRRLKQIAELAKYALITFKDGRSASLEEEKTMEEFLNDLYLMDLIDYSELMVTDPKIKLEIILEAAEKGLEKGDEIKLKSIKASLLFIKQRNSKGNYVNVTGVYRVKKKSLMAKIFDGFSSIASAFVMGTWGAGAVNWIDARYSIARQTNFLTMLYASSYGGMLSKFKGKVNLIEEAKNIVKKGNPEEFNRKLIDDMNKITEEERLHDNLMRKRIVAFVTDYIISNRLILLHHLWKL
jgi:hypothetical protein